MDERSLKALARLGAPVSDERGRAIERALVRSYRQRSRRRRTWTLVGVAGLLLASGWTAARLLESPSAPLAQAPAVLPGPPTDDGRRIRFADGSEITLLQPDSTVRPREVRDDRTVVELLGGSARFAVTSRPGRVFRVETDDVVVTVLGTRFTIERLGPRARVEVTEGSVEVAWSDGHARLRAGQAGLFPPVEALVDPASVVEAGERPRARRAERRDEVGALLASADSARLARRPLEAVGALRRVIAEHPRDERTPLAAFTLGNVLLHELERPEAAAESFARARALAPRGPLAESALVRTAEAHLRSGDRTAAAAAAADYLREYPRGGKARQMRRVAEAP